MVKFIKMTYIEIKSIAANTCFCPSASILGQLQNKWLYIVHIAYFLGVRMFWMMQMGSLCREKSVKQPLNRNLTQTKGWRASATAQQPKVALFVTLLVSLRQDQISHPLERSASVTQHLFRISHQHQSHLSPPRRVNYKFSFGSAAVISSDRWPLDTDLQVLWHHLKVDLPLAQEVFHDAHHVGRHDEVDRLVPLHGQYPVLHSVKVFLDALHLV